MAREIKPEELYFAVVVAKAEMRSILSFLIEICGEIALKDPDNLSVVDRFNTQRRVELEDVFRRLEDSDPALAAKLHSQFERVKNSLGEGNW
jgi:hypothetical protein